MRDDRGPPIDDNLVFFCTLIVGEYATALVPKPATKKRRTSQCRAEQVVRAEETQEALNVCVNFETMCLFPHDGLSEFRDYVSLSFLIFFLREVSGLCVSVTSLWVFFLHNLLLVFEETPTTHRFIRVYAFCLCTSYLYATAGVINTIGQ